MGKTIISLIGLILILISVIMIYDARRIANRLFNSGELNEAAKTLKIVGTIVIWIGIGIIYAI